VKTDLLLDPFGASWADVRSAALAAEAAGFDGIWTWDHLAGSVHRTDGVLECWTILSAIAAVTERVAIGPLVLNVANRHPGTLAPMAATLQQVAGGRLLLGIGAGGGMDLPYAQEQLALGRPVPADPVRRAEVREHVAALRQLWSGRPEAIEGDHVSLRPSHARGFLRPDPPPPVIVGGFGPKMARLAGEVGDGINVPATTPALADLVAVARDAHAAGERAAEPFLVTVFTGYDDAWLRAGAGPRARLEAQGVDRLILLVGPPYRIPSAVAVGA
jgi:alkanesulfonate monooxygenase SsuD/methylene tetrahydromethanopterin reductase-like flavin-dependent oxidoreductase (luciferase family)